jgi:hypothetical protein
MIIKEILIQEIESLTEAQLAEALEQIRLIKAKKPNPPHRKGSGKPILRHAGRWVGNDLKECLERVYTSRGLAEF